VAQWAVDVGLAEAADCPSAGQGVGRAAPWNPLCFSLPLGRPVRLVEALVPAARFLWSRTGRWLWIGLWAAVIAALGHDRTRPLWSALRLDASAAPRFALAWCLLKTLHELGHAATCRLFGGDAPRFGLMFVCGFPSPYVDVTSAWRIGDRNQRILVSLAGVYCESFVAAGALLAAVWSEDALHRQFALALASVSGMSSLLWNLNPLMRFDGYFALVDAWQVPNLAAAGRAAVRYRLRYFLLGKNETPPEPAALRRGVLVYGLLAAVWRGLVVVSLAAFLLKHLGIWVTLALAAPSALAMRRNRHRAIAAPTSIGRMLASWGMTALLGYGALTIWDPCRIRIAAIVDYAEPCVVRTDVAGFVQRMSVVTGQSVDGGDILCELVNPVLDAELNQLHYRIEQSAVRRRMLHTAGDTARAQSEARRGREWEEQYRRLAIRRESLQIRAPQKGVVVTPRADELLGRYLAAGEEVLTLVDPTRRQLTAAADETVALTPAPRSTQRLEVQCGGAVEVLDTALQFGPRAEHAIPHPALAADGGGPLPIRHREIPRPDDRDRSTTVTELAAPHFRLTIPLDASSPLCREVGLRFELGYRTSWPETWHRWTGRGRRLFASYFE